VFLDWQLWQGMKRNYDSKIDAQVGAVSFIKQSYFTFVSDWFEE
jgi:hypothetical protein